MVDYNEGWNEKNYFLTDSEKFKIMTKVYEEIFMDKVAFAKKIGVGRATVFDWFKKDRASFNIKSKIKICQGFRLLDTVWSDTFYTEENFIESLGDYQKIEKKTPVRSWTILTNVKKDKKDDALKIKDLSRKEMNFLLETMLEKKSGAFMFEFAQKLKSEKRIREALKVLDWLEERDNTFKYTHENQIKHLKSIMLSHESIKDYDTAIHLLRSLYHSSSYHLKEPEILTLLASNYKRKALDGCIKKEKIDMTLLTSALCLYEDAYGLKSDNKKYYDAINLAYLYNIVDKIEIEYADKIEIETLYKNLVKTWNIDRDSWWEVCSEAEFLMLLGKIDIAISIISDFLESHRVKPFEIDATFRQLRLYIKFTDDNEAKRFLQYLEESWEILKKN